MCMTFGNQAHVSSSNINVIYILFIFLLDWETNGDNITGSGVLETR